jgi:hypothetical protein
MKPILVLLLPLALGACAVTSETPLFGPKDASAHPLAEGLWAMSGPGCDVGPGQPLPDCAMPLTISGGKMSMDPNTVASRMPGLPAPAPLQDLPAVSDVLLVDGDPSILQLLTAQPNAAPGTPPKPGYLSLKPIHLNGAGRVNRAIMWIILCPRTEPEKAGFKVSPAGCSAQSSEAVRRQAGQVPPFLSFFMTWIGSPAG